MAKLPLVALIGKPNTGKSTLFNRIVGRRKAIVSDIPGTTRDHVSHCIETDEIDYLLIDTGGMGGGSSDTSLEDDVALQSRIAVQHADVIVFVVDARSELSASDYEVTGILRREKQHHVPVLLCLNKCDPPVSDIPPQFYELGMTEEIVCVSALHGSGVGELEDRVLAHLRRLHFVKKSARVAPSADVPRIAIAGRPNSGKSLLCNALMSEPERRVFARLVSSEPGTTRDVTDVTVRHEGREYLVLDTAGIRRQSRREYGIESFAVLRSLQAIQDSDVTLLVLDASRGVARQDKAIAGLAIARGTGLVLLLNKIDALAGAEREEATARARAAFPFCPWAPLLPCSALTRENLQRIFPLIDLVVENRRRRIEEQQLKRWYDDVMAGHLCAPHVPSRVYEIVQVASAPPRFAMVLSHPTLLQWGVLRYYERRLRECFSFEGTPIRWVKRGKD